MNYTITYYNKRVKQQVMALAAGVLADYIPLTDLMQNHGANLHMLHPAQWAAVYSSCAPKAKKASVACFIAHKLDRQLLFCIT